MKDENVKNPFLIVVPTSLVFNWKNEIEKFTPNMNFYIHHGANRENDKKKFNELLQKNDLIITTYGILRNDLKLFSDIKFEYIVLDEAHIIKNPMSISAKTVYSLKGKNKLVISGTPIQNNLTELWSLFNFLNPGYLGGYNFFKENFVSLIEKNEDKTVNDSLKKLISPFLLRRTKKVISDELPEKNEMILRSSFSEPEREIYDNWRDYYKNEINTNISNNGLGKSKIKILEGLMKLRQICLHPKLIDTEYTGSSAKFDLLMMEIEKVLSEGHKVLIFSSFVKMLSIVRKEFEEKGIKYFYLDGQTKNRENIVSKFQESSNAHPFLISIKAGGLGLNLTGADYVFIIDPWWNPAVEMQAMDRAHRIGQKNKVFVYKMIAENTIEEKILKLQDSKKKLVNDLIVEEKSLVKDINIEDIKEIFG
jgi:SNF2 family DNA or RNA helicase